MFQPIYRYFERAVGSDNYTYYWTSKVLPDKNVTATTTSDYKLLKLLK